jgi:hypothetical protein
MKFHVSPKRRLTILDVMILVAATAVGFAAARAIMPVVRDERIAGAWVCLVTLSLAVLFLRLKQPRPRLHRLMTRPGDAACVASLLATLMTALVCLVGFISQIMALGSGIDFSDGPIIGIIATPPAVMAPWLIMALGRRWRSESDWIGWLGRALGIGYVLTLLAAAVLL